MHEKELNYLLRRANEEMDIAQQAGDDIAAKVHRQMAALYTKRMIELDRPVVELVTQPSAAA